MDYRNQDCLTYLKQIDDRSIDLIVTDPPYYRVVKDRWDKQWKTIDEYYEWCSLWIQELGRVAKYSCSFWLFGYPRNVTPLLPVIEGAGFSFKQQIIVNKGLRAVAGRTKLSQRVFPTTTESIFFFHYDARDYISNLLESERNRLKLKTVDMNTLLGLRTTGGGAYSAMTTSNKEKRSYPKRQHWIRMSEVFNLPSYDDVVYKFNLPQGITDVWSDINFYDRNIKKIHPTQKPEKLIERIIKTSSNINDTVLDLFVGSGTTPLVCKQNDRNFLGCEIDPEYYQSSMSRILRPDLSTMSIF